MKQREGDPSRNEPHSRPHSGARGWILTTTAGAITISLLLGWWLSVKDHLFAGDPSVETKPTTERSSRPATAPMAESFIPDTRQGTQWKTGQIWTNSIGMKMAFVPPGEFVTSMEESMSMSFSHKPAAPHRIATAFLIATTEVTQAEWRIVMGSSPWSGREDVMSGDNYPASYVTWDGAVTFCKKLSEKEGKTYRLPTQNEWTYACQAGTKTVYSFGEWKDRERLKDFAWFDANTKLMGEKYPHRVSQKQPNPWGLYDVHGNVSEWCSDLSKQGSTTHVFCGGSWLDGDDVCTSDCVLHDFAGDGGRSDVGFRVCVDLYKIVPPAAGDRAFNGDRNAAKPQTGAGVGLGRAGYSPDRCLICDAHRSDAAKATYGDKNGFGLCDDCGPKYRAWIGALKRTQGGLAPDSDDRRVTDDFKAMMSDHFHRDDSDGRRGIGLIFLMGKFASPEWDTLTGGE